MLPGAESNFRKAVLPPPALLGTGVSAEGQIPACDTGVTPWSLTQRRIGGSDGSQSL